MKQIILNIMLVLILIFSSAFADTSIKKVKIKIPRLKAEKLKIYKDGKATYSELTGEISFDAQQFDGTGFCLIHDGVTAFAITDEPVTTIHVMEAYITLQEALDRIKALGLKYEEEPAVKAKVIDVRSLEK